MFTINVINWVIDFVHLNIVARLTLIDNPGFDLATKYSNAVKVASHWTLIQTTLASYLVSRFPSLNYFRRGKGVQHVQFCVGDAIIIWRVGVFWPGRRERLVMILPCAILLGNFGKLVHTGALVYISENPTVAYALLFIESRDNHDHLLRREQEFCNRSERRL